jgi:hypothetical protein
VVAVARGGDSGGGVGPRKGAARPRS